MKTQSSCDEVPKLVHSQNVSARVLIVEDSRTQAEWLAQVLSREGYDVRIAADGRRPSSRSGATHPISCSST